MEKFLASLKKESQEYTNTAVGIEEYQHEFGVQFNELEDQVNLKVKNLKRPMTVMEKSRFSREVKVRSRSAKSELSRAHSKPIKRRKEPNTARTFSRGNNFDVDYRRNPKNSSKSPKIWVTDDFPVSTAREADFAVAKVNFPNVYFCNENDQMHLRKRNLQSSSHHFDGDRFEEPIKSARRQNPNKKWTSPLCVRKIERKLTEDERFYEERYNEDPFVDHFAF